MPIPDELEVSDDNDRHVTILMNDTLSPEHGCVWDLTEVGFKAGSRNSNPFDVSDPVASWAAVTHTRESGWFSGASTRGSSAAAAGGAITTQELANGYIPHAVALSVHAEASGPPVLPSHTSDGTSSKNTSLPAGARVTYAPGVDPSKWPEPARTIGTAIKDYGGFVIDQHSGPTSFIGYADRGIFAGQTYPWGPSNAEGAKNEYPTLDARLTHDLVPLGDADPGAMSEGDPVSQDYTVDHTC